MSFTCPFIKLFFYIIPILTAWMNRPPQFIIGSAKRLATYWIFLVFHPVFASFSPFQPPSLPGSALWLYMVNELTPKYEVAEAKLNFIYSSNNVAQSTIKGGDTTPYCLSVNVCMYVTESKYPTALSVRHMLQAAKTKWPLKLTEESQQNFGYRYKIFIFLISNFGFGYWFVVKPMKLVRPYLFYYRLWSLRRGWDAGAAEEKTLSGESGNFCNDTKKGKIFARSVKN